MRTWALLGLLAMALCGCARRPPAAPKGRLPLPDPGAGPPEAEVVATVNGRPITIADVAAQARAASQAPAEALEALLRAEAVAQLADERGLAGDPEVQRAARQEMARRYLQDSFEREYTPESVVSAADIRKAYDQAKGRLVHPLLKEVDHILVRTAAASDKAAALSAEIHQAAAAAPDLDAFKKVAEERREAAKAQGFELISERVVTGREGWTAEPFAKAAFDLQKPGDLSPVVQTTFGYHVIRLRREIPAENVTLEEATPRIRKDLYPRLRAREFERWVERQAVKHQVLQHPDRLTALQQGDQ